MYENMALVYIFISVPLFFNGPSPASFSFFLFKQASQFLQKKYVKKTVLGFEPTTSRS